MSEPISTATLLRQLDFDLNGLLRGVDVSETRNRRIFDNVKKLLVAARAGFYSYEYAESRPEQLQHAATLIGVTTRMQQQILLGSQYDLFSAIDVAEVSANIDRFNARIKE